MEGASRLLRDGRFGDVSELNALMDMLERRVALLGVLRTALNERDVMVRIGTENDAPGAALGRAGRRRLRAAAAAARRGVGDRPAADGLRPRDQLRARRGRAAVELRRRGIRRAMTCYARLLRGARRRSRRRRRRDQEGVPPPGARASPRRQPPRPAGRGEVQGGGRGLRGAVRSRPAGDVRPLRPRGAAQRRLRARTSRGSARWPTSSRRSSAAASPFGDIFGSGATGRRRAPGRRRRGRRRRSSSPTRPAGPASSSPTTRSRCASTATATAPSPARRSRPARGAAAAASSASCPADAVRPDGAQRGVRRLRRRRPGRRARRARRATGAGGTSSGPRSRSTCPPGIADGQRIRDRRPRPRRRARRPARRPVRPGPRPRGPAVRPRRRRSRDRGRRGGAAGGARDDRRGADASTARSSSRSRPEPSRTTRCMVRGAGMPALRAARRKGDLRVVVNVSSRATSITSSASSTSGSPAR